MLSNWFHDFLVCIAVDWFCETSHLADTDSDFQVCRELADSIREESNEEDIINAGFYGVLMTHSCGSSGVCICRNMSGFCI